MSFPKPPRAPKSFAQPTAPPQARRDFVLPRFYPILDSAALERKQLDPLPTANSILDGGARILQFRHKGFFNREMLTLMERLAEMCAQAGALFVVNDRADLARMLGAVLHVGQDDLFPSQARRVTGDSTVVGFSTHNETQLRAAAQEPADYLALGPIFGTSSKLNPDPVVGVHELRRLRPLTERPLVAIGSITRANARSVLEAGADSVAIIGDLFPPDADSFPMNPSVRNRVAEWIELTKE
jgi:thiamine-phosphate pyrophosphorylase